MSAQSGRDLVLKLLKSILGWKNIFLYVSRDLGYMEGLCIFLIHWKLDTVDLHASFSANVLTTSLRDKDYLIWEYNANNKSYDLTLKLDTGFQGLGSALPNRLWPILYLPHFLLWF